MTAAPARSTAETRRLANAVRALAMDGVEKAQSGHPGMPMGMADVATVLFDRFLKFDPADPAWPDRDRFVLSAGHGSMLLYALLHLTGYSDMTMEELKKFRQLGSRTAGHPEFGHAAGIETTTGPLGQGLANAVGMALAERLMADRFGADLVDHYTYVIAGDGCLMEGISHEAISLAGHLGLSKLIVLFDDNGISIDGPTGLTVSDDQVARFKASGWNAEAVDGHDAEAVAAAIARARGSDKPSMIACKTTIAYGAPKKAGTSGAHGSPLGAAEIEGARQALDWTAPAFVVPDDIAAAWRAIGARGAATRAAWTKRHDAAATRAEFDRVVAGRLPEGLDAAFDKLLREVEAEAPKTATRQSSGRVIDTIQPLMPELVGGSADLTPSNNTKGKAAKPIARGSFAGGYVHWGVREHAMAAGMNGLSLHGGVVPFGGTFLVFTDYARPAIRLSALMQRRVIYVMTHDSIGLGEDGPTHQPVEHLAALRAIPGLAVFRPADTVETIECWRQALAEKGPSVLALSRQSLPAVRTKPATENLSARGGYVLSEANGARRATLIATGSEVHVALAAQAKLAAENIPVAVVSMPSTTLFERQDAAYRAQVLGPAPRMVIEAGVGFGWERHVGADGVMVVMTSFGASAPLEDAMKHFGFTPDNVVAALKTRLG